jgi:hypothetical protein
MAHELRTPLRHRAGAGRFARSPAVARLAAHRSGQHDPHGQPGARHRRARELPGERRRAPILTRYAATRWPFMAPLAVDLARPSRYRRPGAGLGARPSRGAVPRRAQPDRELPSAHTPAQGSRSRSRSATAPVRVLDDGPGVPAADANRSSAASGGATATQGRKPGLGWPSWPASPRPTRQRHGRGPTGGGASSRPDCARPLDRRTVASAVRNQQAKPRPTAAGRRGRDDGTSRTSRRTVSQAAGERARTEPAPAYREKEYGIWQTMTGPMSPADPPAAPALPISVFAAATG